MISVRHAVPREDVLLGIVRADSVSAERYPDNFDAMLDALLEHRKADLTPPEEACRIAARDMLRNGSYKPTGRAKPASEYLLRAVARDDFRFPRINAPVDICNFLSLKHVVPISLWDVDLAQTNHFLFRLGRTGEQFVFNDGGQTIDVTDLLVGCRVREDADSADEPIINPVKDSLLTKTTPSTSRVAACIYAPSDAVSQSDLDGMVSEFADLLVQCGDAVDAGTAVLSPGERIDV